MSNDSYNDMMMIIFV